MTVRGWIDRLVGPYAVLFLREATGRSDPLPHVIPTRAAALAPGQRLAFWSLCAGVGTSTLAALVAHRSTAAGAPALLFDLDRRAPSLALRAGISGGATVADALLRPGREAELVSRWSGTPFLPGAPGLHATADGARLGAVVDGASAGRPVVIDLGSGAEALDEVVLARCTRLVICVGTRVAQLQAAFCALPLLSTVTEPPIALAVIDAADDDGRRIAGRLPWPLVSIIPPDEHLARDDFGARSPTLHAVDRLIRALS